MKQFHIDEEIASWHLGATRNDIYPTPNNREKVFPPYQVNAQLVGEADKDVIVMHCLPAHRNHELTDDVADGPHSVIFQQAHNRLHAQKAILARLFGVG